MSTSPFVLVNILKLYQTEYYNEYIKPLLKNNNVEFGLNLNDDFSITDIRCKAEQKLYKYPNENVYSSKVIRFVHNTKKMFIQKEFDAQMETWTTTFLTAQ